MRSVPLEISIAAVLAAVVAVLAPGPSMAADGRGLSEARLVDQVLSLYLPGEGGALEKECPTTLMKRVKSRWNELSEENREKLKPYVLQPGQERPGGVPGAPGDYGFKKAQTKHFMVLWQDDGVNTVRPGDENGNGLPDYVEKVGRFLERAWVKEVDEFGFLPPPSSPKYRVYLKGLNHNGLTHPDNGNGSWIEINANIEAYTRKALGAKFGPHVSADPDGFETGLLKAVCAHEFFHAVQANYDWNEPAWLAEGSAEWMGEMVFPESDFYLNNLALHLQQPHISLFSDDLWFEYSASLFTGFLVENLGGPKVLKRVWEASRGANGMDAVAQVVGDPREVFMAFWAYNYLRAYRDGPKYPLPEALAVRQYPFQLSSSEIAEPQHYGANLIALEDLGGQAITVTLEPGKGSIIGAKLIRFDDAKKWRITPVGSSDGGVISATVEDAARAVIVIGSFGPSKPGSYTLSVTR